MMLGGLATWQRHTGTFRASSSPGHQDSSLGRRRIRTWGGAVREAEEQRQLLGGWGGVKATAAPSQPPPTSEVRYPSSPRGWPQFDLVSQAFPTMCEMSLILVTIVLMRVLVSSWTLQMGTAST